MAKKEVEFLSKNAYAAYLGINEKAVRNAITTGKIKKGWDAEKKKIIKHIADKEFGVLHQVAKVQRGVSKADVFNKIQVRKKSENSEQNQPTSEKLNKSEKTGVDTVLNSDNSIDVIRPDGATKIVIVGGKSLQNEFEVKDATNEKYSNRRNKNAVMGKPSRPSKKANQEADEDDSDDDLELIGLDFNPNASLQDVIKLIQVTPYLSYADALTKREIVGLAMDKIKLEELDGLLVRKTEVERNLFTIGDRLKKALLAIPVRCADELLNATNKVEAVNIMTEEINLVLNTFANFENS